MRHYADRSGRINHEVLAPRIQHVGIDEILNGRCFYSWIYCLSYKVEVFYRRLSVEEAEAKILAALDQYQRLFPCISALADDRHGVSFIRKRMDGLQATHIVFVLLLMAHACTLAIAGLQFITQTLRSILPAL